MKTIGILGATGSIGTQTLDIVREHRDELQVAALAAGENVALMETLIREFRPRIAAMWSEQAYRDLKTRIADLEINLVYGMEGLLEIAVMEEMDILVTAVVGMIGIKPTLAAIRAGKNIALANKETLVTAGHIIMPLVRQHGVQLLPVDSEHSAVWQALQGEEQSHVEQILLTASGGPFRGRKKEALSGITVEDALKHPNWSMGKKITVDSATLVNKGLEVIEAKWLFDVTSEQIRVVVHPQSIIHSMVTYQDGSVIAQMGVPDMKLPIRYALFYPDRKAARGERVDFYNLSGLTFEPPDMEVFRGLLFAYQALAAGGSMPTVFNAANERAVSLFLNRKISFLQIYELIEGAMAYHRIISNPTVSDILHTEEEAYDYIRKEIKC